MIGLGGAYAALAEYSEGVYANSAGSAVRVPWSVTRFDYDLGPSLTVPGTFQNTDFENRGRIGQTNRFNNSINLGLGLQAQYGPFGATVTFDYTGFDLEPGPGKTRSGSINLDRAMISLGYSLFSGQLLLGGGLRGALVGVVDGIPSFNSFGVGPHVGAIWAPTGVPFRLGASYRDTVEVTQIRGTETAPDGSQIASGRILPSRAVLPWEVQLGIMFGLGGYPANGEWIDPVADEAPVRNRYERARLERVAVLEARAREAPPEQRVVVRRQLEEEERDTRAREDVEMERELERLLAMREAWWRSWNRRGVMVVADLLFTGGSPTSIGVEDFIDQKLQPSGRVLTASPRLGVETEVWPHWVKARTGTYVEPSRFPGGLPRAHFTAGLDFRLFVFNPLGIFSKAPMRLRLVGDVAPRYSNFGFALGTWH
jgi:hypothetical protein